MLDYLSSSSISSLFLLLYTDKGTICRFSVENVLYVNTQAMWNRSSWIQYSRNLIELLKFRVEPLGHWSCIVSLKTKVHWLLDNVFIRFAVEGVWIKAVTVSLTYRKKRNWCWIHLKINQYRLAWLNNSGNMLGWHGCWLTSLRVGSGFMVAGKLERPFAAAMHLTSRQRIFAHLFSLPEARNYCCSCQVKQSRIKRENKW